MILRRVLPSLAAAAAATLAAALLALPASGQAAERSLTVTVPATVTELQTFPVIWSGNTGDGPLTRDGSRIRVSFYYGDAPCPAATAPEDAATWAATPVSGSVSHLGEFRSGGQVYADRSGLVRVCGSFGSPRSDSWALSYEPVFSTVITVLPRTKRLRLDATKPRIGTYTATLTDINGGGPDATFSFVLKKKGLVSSISAKGIAAATSCIDPSKPSSVPATFVSATPSTLPSRFIGTDVGAGFKQGDTHVNVEMTATSATSTSGTLSAFSADSNCRSGFGFTAKRVSGSQAKLR